MIEAGCEMKTICYLAGGYPTMEKSLEMAALYLKGGCDAIEWSFPPKDPYLDPEYIAEKMRIARMGCEDYAVYLEELAGFKKRYPQAEVFLLLYQETVFDIGLKHLVAFCCKNGIDTLISADLSDPSAKTFLMNNGIQIAASVSYTMMPRELEMALSSNGFVYVQAMPTKADLDAGRGPETLKECIQKLRELGINRPVYCGVGIRSPKDVKLIKASGGEGFFIGSSVMQHYDDPGKLVQTIREYKEAAEMA
jgi:tryptophan synthase alpha chain